MERSQICSESRRPEGWWNKRADLLRIDDAVNQGQEAAIRLRADPKDGYLTKTGAAALPQDGIALTDRYTAQLDSEFTRIEGTLSNDRQRELWRAKKQTLRNQFLDNALSHEGQQIKTYEASVNEATGSQASEMIGQLPQNPASVRLHTYRLQASIMGGVDPDNQGEFDDSFRKSAINVTGGLFGLPAAQMNRTITGAQALNEGKTENPAALLLGFQEPH